LQVWKKHLTPLGWDFVVATFVQHLGVQPWYFLHRMC
jgi:hypothetical protein